MTSLRNKMFGTLCVLLGILMYLPLSLDGAVLGIDLGGEFFKVAMVGVGRPFEILLNNHSKRKTPSAVSFADDIRFFGEDAIAHNARAPKSVFQYLPALLAFNVTDAMLNEESISSFVTFPPTLYYPYDYRLDEARNSIQIRIKDDIWASPEEVLAHIFWFIRDLAKTSTGTYPTDCVVAVPTWFGMRQRQAVKDAATISGLNVIALVHQSSAAALQHSLDLDFVVKSVQPPVVDNMEKSNATTADTITSESDKNATDAEATTKKKKKEQKKKPAKEVIEITPIPPRKKLVFNAGSYTTESCVATYSTHTAVSLKKTKLTMDDYIPEVTMNGCVATRPGITEYRGLGGHLIDIALATEMGKIFVDSVLSKTAAGSTYKSIKDLTQRALKKLLNSATKAKSVLSANKEVTFSVESLMNDLDFRTRITRDEIEAIIAKTVDPSMKYTDTPSEVVNREISLLVAESLKLSNTTSVDDLESFEVIGGAWRVPLVQSSLEAVSKSKLSQRMNADEAAALGAAYIAANHSSIFRTRMVYFTDVSTNTYSISATPLPFENRILKESNFDLPHEEPMYPGISGFNRDIVIKGKKLGRFRSASFDAHRDLEVKLFENGHLMSAYIVNGVVDAWVKQSNLLFRAQKEAEETGDDEMATKAENHMRPLRTSLQFAISKLGIVELNGATVSFVERNLVPPPAKILEADQANSTISTQEPENNNTTVANATSEKPDVDSGTDIPIETSTATELPKYILRTVARKIAVEVSKVGLPIPLNATQIDEATDRLREFESHDEQIKSRDKSRDELESYIYSIRDRLETESYIAVTTEELREEINLKLSEVGDWLYEDGFTANRTVLDDKKTELEFVTNTVIELAQEYELRPLAAKEVPKIISEANDILMKYNETRPWIPPNVIANISSLITETSTWFDDLMMKQSKLSLTELPAFRVADVLSVVKKLTKRVEKLNKFRKPKPSVNATATNDTITDAGDAETKTDDEATGNVHEDILDENLENENLENENLGNENLENENLGNENLENEESIVDGKDEL